MPDRITSVQNPRVKAAARLRDRHGRDDQQRILIDGARETERAIASGVAVLELFATCDSLHASEHESLRQAREAGVEILDVTPPVYRKLAYGQRETGIVSVARTPQRELADLQLPPDSLVAVLEGVEKPGNIGAVVRTADAAGISAVLVADGGTDLFNPNAIRASAGTIFSLPVVASTSSRILGWLREESYTIYAARVEATTRFWEASFRCRTAIVLGSEALGLTDAWSAGDIHPISIPQQGLADSLNVSVTAAILFYEAVRQRATN